MTSVQVKAEAIPAESIPTTTEPDVGQPQTASRSMAGTSSSRKRCPKCNAVYDDELIAYCAHHIVRLIDVDAPVTPTTATPPQAHGMTPLLWILVIATLCCSVYAGYLITSYLEKTTNGPPRPAAATAQNGNVLKGIPVVGGDLVGATIRLPDAECPLKASGETVSGIVIVHVLVDQSGRVYRTESSGEDQALREAAIAAALKATFSPERLGGHRAEGTITYTFRPRP
jgi:TonB family protein